MIKVLLLGVGRWGVNHLRVAGLMPVELFVADPAPQSLALARQAGVAEDHLGPDPMAFTDAVDAAVVTTPAQSHFELCRHFLDAGKDVFVEKPITLQSARALELAQIAARRELILQVGHIFRFDAASQWLRAAVTRGDFGSVRILRGTFSGFKRPRSDTGVMFADAIHFADLFNFILGSAPRRVMAVTRDSFGRGMEDEALLVMEYAGENGTVMARVEAGYHLPGKYREVIVTGDRLSAVCDYNVAQYKLRTFRNEHRLAGAGITAAEGEMHQLEFTPEEPLLAEWRAFLHSVATRSAPIADAMAGYEAVRIIEAALASAQSGHFVELEQKQG